MAYPEFIQEFLRVRGRIEIDIHPHAAERMDQRPEATADRVEAAVRRGRIDTDRSSPCQGKPYSKIVVSHYDGKAVVTVEVVVLHHEAFEIAEVRTVWVRAGRSRRTPPK
jgi:hypothetical protein